MNTGRPVTVSFNPTIRAPRDSRSQREERYWLVSGQYIPDADSNVIFNHVLRTMGGVPNGVRFVLEGEEGYAELHIHGIIELIPDRWVYYRKSYRRRNPDIIRERNSSSFSRR